MERLSSMPQPGDILLRKHDFEFTGRNPEDPDYVDFKAEIITIDEQIEYTKAQVLHGGRSDVSREVAVLELMKRDKQKGNRVGIAPYRIIECKDRPEWVGQVDSCIFEFNENGRGILTYNRHWRKA